MKNLTRAQYEALLRQDFVTFATRCVCGPRWPPWVRKYSASSISNSCSAGKGFGRLDNLYLDTRLEMGQARARYLRRHPLRRFKLNARLLAEAAAIFLLLMRGVPDPALRREYRRRLMRAAWCRREPEIIQNYALKCAMHFHAHQMVQEMLSQPQLSTRAAA